MVIEMSMRILSMMIFFCIVGAVDGFFHRWLQKKEAKKNNYDCSKCGVWDCPYKTCKQYKEVK